MTETATATDEISEGQPAAIRGFVLRSVVLEVLSLAAVPAAAWALDVQAMPLLIGALGGTAAAVVCLLLSVRAVEGRLMGSRESQPLAAVAAGTLVRMVCLGLSMAIAFVAFGREHVLACGIFFLALFPVFRASEALFFRKALAVASSVPRQAAASSENETPLQESRP